MSKTDDSALGWLQKIPERNRDRVFLIDGTTGFHLSFGDLHQEALKVARLLRRQGLAPGDSLAMQCDNSLWTVKLCFGALYAGVMVVPINPHLSKKEADFIVQDSGAKMAVSETDHSPWNLDALPLDDGFQPFDGVSSECDLAMVYTSGTMAAPKGVVHRIRDFVENAKAFGRMMDLGSANRFYTVFPLSYMAGFFNGLLLPFVCESSVVLGRPLSPTGIRDFWTTAIRHEANTLWLAPSMMSILMHLDRDNEGESFCRDSVQCAWVGTAPLNADLLQGFEERYGLQVLESYGLSETLLVTSHLPGSGDRMNSVGTVLPQVELQVTDEQGKLLPSGHEGEIAVRTPYLMRGYHKAGTKAACVELRDGWFHTGDLGCLSEAKRLSITGRKKDLIIRGGINISPASIEEVLRRHPAVMDCAVVGVPDEIQGEDIVAVVRISDDESFEAVKEGLTELCRQNLSRIKWPGKYLTLKEFPHTPSGKIVKRKIRAWAQQGSVSRKQGSESVVSSSGATNS